MNASILNSMAGNLSDIKLAAEWLTYILETSMPDWLKEQIPDSAKEWIESAKGLVNLPSEEQWEHQTELDVNRFNNSIGKLRNDLVNMEPDGSTASVASRRSKQRDEFCKQLIKNGWVYSWDDESGFILSGSKGDDCIEYENMELGDFEFVRVSKLDKELIEWDIFELELKDKTKLYVASIPAWEIDLTSRVPALEKKIDHLETSKRILNPNRKRHHWQRKLNKVNKNSISSFFDSEKSFFANPVIIHIPNYDFVKIQLDGKTGKCKVRLSFLEKVEDEWTSFNAGKRLDSRPITIIDGQHRVRGAADAYHNFNDNLLAIILPPEIDENRAGKIFAEINTLSVELDKKHRLFLAHRFAVSAPQPEFDFEAYDGTDKTERARANRMAYDLAAKMLIESEFWEKKIKILDQNKAQNQVLDIEKWLTYTYQWFEDYP